MPLLAAEFTTQVHDIDYGQKKGDEVLVFLTDGHVAKLRESHDLLNKNFMQTDLKKNWYKVTLDDDRYIVDMEVAPAPYKVKKSRFPKIHFGFNAPMSYVPTVIKDMATAKKYFSEARYNPKESQCFNRALVWTYEWWKKHSLKSNKVLIFFTRNYIRRYNFEWWFHISPLVHVMEDGKVVERTMDRKYTNGPRKLVDWANIFLSGDPACPIIQKFSEYADNPYTGMCYLIRTHMYTYQPADLQMYEAWGYSKETFNLTEVGWAYKEAFDETFGLPE
jgi:hypothetical protein